jgi:hypothetical protein
MNTPTQLTCDACGTQFDLTPDYLAQYGGPGTTCSCGHALTIPAAEGVHVPVLSYRAPALPTKVPGGVWRDGVALVIRRGVRLPNRCAVCGVPVPATFRPTRVDDPTNASFTLTGQLINSAMKQPVTIRFGYCPQHARWIMPRTARLIRWISFILVTPLIMAAVIAKAERSFLFYPLTGLAISAFALPFVLSFREAPIRVLTQDYKHAWLLGFGQDYLQHFPPLDEANDQDLTETAMKLDQLASTRAAADRT